jgi:hypothetical protein
MVLQIVHEEIERVIELNQLLVAMSEPLVFVFATLAVELFALSHKAKLLFVHDVPCKIWSPVIYHKHSIFQIWKWHHKFLV